jgi:hypothetical protein
MQIKTAAEIETSCDRNGRVILRVIDRDGNVVLAILPIDSALLVSDMLSDACEDAVRGTDLRSMEPAGTA